MKKYEYMELYDSEVVPLVDKVNEAGQEGWRLVGYTIADGGKTLAMMEREKDPEDFTDKDGNVPDSYNRMD